MKWKNRKERPQHHGIYHIKDEKTGKGIYYFGTKYNKWFWSLPEDGLINVSKEVGKGYDFVWLDESEQDEGWVPVEKVKLMIKHAWEEAQWSFVKDGGEDVSDVEEDGPIAATLEEYLKREFPSSPATKD